MTPYTRSALLLASILVLASCVDERGNPLNPSSPKDPAPAVLAIAPDSIGTTVGNSVQFAAMNMDSVVYAAWAVESGVGTISQTGLFTAPASLTRASARTRIVLWDKRDTTRRAWAIVDIDDPNYTPPVDTTICFTRDVLPLINSNCAMAGCHDGSDREARSLKTYSEILSYVSRKNGVYTPERSKLYTSLLGGEEPMPRDRDPLTAAQILVIKRWINQGAKNTDCAESTCDTSAVVYADVQKIMTLNCTGGCHSGKAPSGGIDLTQESVVRAQVTVGTLIATIEHQPGE
jgi:hypothetical protein